MSNSWGYGEMTGDDGVTHYYGPDGEYNMPEFDTSCDPEFEEMLSKLEHDLSGHYPPNWDGNGWEPETNVK